MYRHVLYNQYDNVTHYSGLCIVTTYKQSHDTCGLYRKQEFITQTEQKHAD